MDIDRSGYEVLPPEECLALLDKVRTGRLAIHVGALPTIVPVGFALLENAIVLGAIKDEWFRAATQDAVVAFEVDDVDGQTGNRWSVVVIGVASDLCGLSAEETVHIRSRLGPWSDPTGQRLIRLNVHVLSGRRSYQVDPPAEPSNPPEE